MSRHDLIHGQFVFGFAKTISTQQAAQRLKTSSQSIRRMLESGELRGYKLRDREKSPWLVYAWSVERHIERLKNRHALDVE